MKGQTRFQAISINAVSTATGKAACIAELKVMLADKFAPKIATTADADYRPSVSASLNTLHLPRRLQNRSKY